MLRKILREAIEEEIFNAYHGSPSGDIVTGKFKKGKRGYMGPGIYFSKDIDYAKHYAKQMGSGTLYTVRISLDNPLVLTSANPTEEMLTQLYGSPVIYKRRAMKQSMDTYIIESKDIKKLFSLGYDGVIWKYAGNEEYVLYDNSQIEILEKNEVGMNESKSNINEAMKDTFSFDTLSSLPSFAQRIRYCKEQLGQPIGNGSSRMVFQIDDEKCLKLAKNEKGMAQNDAEYDWGAQNYGVMPKLYDSAEDGESWIVVEYVLPAKKQDFKHCLGITWEDYCRFVIKVYNRYARRPMPSSMSDDEYQMLLDNNEWLARLDSYMADYQVPFGDLVGLRNYGLVMRDGDPEIVILDSGLTQQIWEEYYKR